MNCNLTMLNMTLMSDIQLHNLFPNSDNMWFNRTGQFYKFKNDKALRRLQHHRPRGRTTLYLNGTNLDIDISTMDHRLGRD